MPENCEGHTWRERLMKLARSLCLLTTLVWVHKSFLTAAGAVEFLNKLPEERAMEAKIVCWDARCIVAFRIEEELPPVEESAR